MRFLGVIFVTLHGASFFGAFVVSIFTGLFSPGATAKTRALEIIVVNAACVTLFCSNCMKSLFLSLI